MKSLYSLFFLLSVLLVSAQEEAASKMDPKAQVFSSEQSVTINGRAIALSTEAGTFQLNDDQDQPLALFGYTYYRQKNGSDQRPIMFAYNGGPGSSSFWLHMGILGPKRIPINDPGFTDPAPYELVNNDYSVLDQVDLVMIDPIGTGLSRPLGDKEFKDFWGVDQDIESISKFIRQFLIRKGRMNAPKYLLGESYGTFRNAGVMAALQDMGVTLNGVIMVSAVFDLRHLMFPPHEDLSYIVHFPTYAATAWYHDLIENKPEDVYTFLDEVRTFTRDEYQPALFKGDQLTASEKDAIASKLATYSGLSKDYWIKADLRVRNGEYFQEAMRDKGKIVGRLDSRFTGINSDLIRQYADHDPQSAAISPPYITGFLNYLYNDLKVDPNLHYQTSAGSRQGFSWDWKHRGNTSWNAQVAVNTGIDMARAMLQNPKVKVLILNGIYDLATVFYGVEYTIDHLGLTPEIKENIIMKYYEAGHMMYTHEPSMIKFKEDVGGFITETLR
jgi:carboxypeptidase C (cathepsin A)